MFQKSPPRYMVFESLEQFALSRLDSYQNLPLQQFHANTENSLIEKSSIPLHGGMPRMYRRSDLPAFGSRTLTPLDTRIGLFDKVCPSSVRESSYITISSLALGKGEQC